MLACLLVGLAACKDELEDPIDPSTYQYDYFPLKNGQSRIYQVDSIRFDVGASSTPITDSSSFFIQENYVEVFENEVGEETYRIERYKARSMDGPWEILDVVSQVRSTTMSTHSENNLKFINLIFPPVEGEKWDGNAFINDNTVVLVRGEGIEMFKNWSYEILSVDQSETIGDRSYDRVLTVQQAEDENEIEIRRSFEKYAMGIGLVYRERWIMDSYCKYTGNTQPCIGEPWRAKAGRGFISRETLVEYR